MNWGERTHRGRLLGLLTGMCGGPPVALAAYLAVAPWVAPAWWGIGLVAAVVLGLAIGLACIARLPDPVAVRVTLAVLYVPAACGGLLLLWAVADRLSYGG